MSHTDAQLRELILPLVPDNGSTIGNARLLKQLSAQSGEVDRLDDDRVRDALVAEGVLGKGRGRGGSVYLTQPPYLREDPTQEEPPTPELPLEMQVEVHNFDYFDTKSGELKSGGKRDIAEWELDTDYDDRSLYPRQVLFPMAGKKDGWYKLKKDIRAKLNEELLGQYHGTWSLPFEPGDSRCIAVKIVDNRGIESLKVVRLD